MAINQGTQTWTNRLPPPDPRTRRVGKMPPDGWLGLGAQSPVRSATRETRPSTVFVLAALSVVGAIIAFIAAGAAQRSAQSDRITDNVVRSWDNSLNGANNEMLGPVATNYIPGIAFLIVAALLVTWGVILAAGGQRSAR